MAAGFWAFLILAVVAVAGVSAQTHHFVGGGDGWVPEMNVSSWLAGRVFKVGDKLWFKNSGATEAILEVRGPEEFEACDLRNPIRMYTDHVALEEGGVRYFVSGNLENCRNGLKLPVPVESDLDPVWPEPHNPSPGFDPVRPDLAPPEPYWPAPEAFPPERYEPPSEPYDPPVKPSFPPPEEPHLPPPSRPSGAPLVKGIKGLMMVGLLIGCVISA